MEENKIILKSSEVDKTVENWFKKFDGVVKQFEKQAKIKIDNDKNMKRAEQIIRDIKDKKDEIAEVKDKFGKPVYKLHRKIVNRASLYSSPLSSIEKEISKNIYNYKQVQAAMLRKERDEKMEDVDKTLKDMEKEAELISRLEQKCNAMIFGGIYTKKNKQREQFRPLAEFDQQYIQKIKDTIKNNLPAVESFEHFSEEFKDLKIDLSSRLTDVEANVITMNAETTKKGDKTKIAKHLASTHSGAMKRRIDREEELDNKMVIHRDREKKEISTKVGVYTKGIRETIKFSLADIEKVPYEYLELNEKALNSFKGSNFKIIKDRIKKGENENIIPGVHFYIERGSSVRR